MKSEKDVQPIRNQQQLDDMKWALKRHCSERDYILFILGCETACVSEIFSGYLRTRSSP